MKAQVHTARQTTLYDHAAVALLDFFFFLRGGEPPATSASRSDRSICGHRVVSVTFSPRRGQSRPPSACSPCSTYIRNLASLDLIPLDGFIIERLNICRSVLGFHDRFPQGCADLFPFRRGSSQRSFLFVEDGIVASCCRESACLQCATAGRLRRTDFAWQAGWKKVRVCPGQYLCGRCRR